MRPAERLAFVPLPQFSSSPCFQGLVNGRSTLCESQLNTERAAVVCSMDGQAPIWDALPRASRASMGSQTSIAQGPAVSPTSAEASSATSSSPSHRRRHFAQPPQTASSRASRSVGPKPLVPTQLMVSRWIFAIQRLALRQFEDKWDTKRYGSVPTIKHIYRINASQALLKAFHDNAAGPLLSPESSIQAVGQP